MLKRYYRLELRQTSPLHLSNGDQELTDSDLMKDNRNLPFIPGTGLTGVLRDLLPESEAKALFGWIDGAKQQASRVLVSDAVLPAGTKEKDLHITWRDGVSLDLFRGTAVPGAKYDLETVETACPYTAVLEWTGEEGDETAAILEKLISHIVSKGLSLGGKVTRGYGAMAVTALKKDFRMPAELGAWLGFSPRESNAGEWEPVAGKAMETSVKTWQVFFRLNGPMAVRVYSSEVGEADFVAMTNSAGKPVIPGTSWAGAFRHQMLEIAGELKLTKEQADIEQFFGKLEKDTQRSAIWFSETEIQGGAPLEITRNALDRFTSGPAMSALFTAGYWYGGEGVLLIRVDKGALTPLLEQLLLAALKDLDLGLMTVGGSASTGLGQLRITEVQADGQPCELWSEVK